MNSNLEQETKSHQIESLPMANGSDDHEGINSTPSLLEPLGKNKQYQYIITRDIYISVYPSTGSSIYERYCPVLPGKPSQCYHQS